MVRLQDSSIPTSTLPAPTAPTSVRRSAEANSPTRAADRADESWPAQDHRASPRGCEPICSAESGQISAATQWNHS